MQSMPLDFFHCLTQQMSIFEKYRLSSCSASLRLLLKDLFCTWDDEFADHISSMVDYFSKFEMRMFSEGRGKESWITTKMCVPPRMTLEWKRGCHAFEHVRLTDMSVRYEVEPLFPEAFVAKPIILYAEFGEVETLRTVPVKEIVWEVHHDKEPLNEAFMLGSPFIHKGTEIYVRTHNVVSADVSTVHPRVRIEMMGIAELHRDNYDPSNSIMGAEGHINMTQLRLYVQRERESV